MSENEDKDYSAIKEFKKAVNYEVLDTVNDLAQIEMKDAVVEVLEKESILADIPILKWMISGIKTISSISKILSIRKFNAFIIPIKNSGIFSDNNYKEKLEEICGSKKKLNFVIEQTLFSLDKYETEIKAKWLARLFIATFKERKFSVDEYNAIQFSIASLNPITSISTLKFYYEYRRQKQETGIIDEELEQKRVNTDYSPLVLSGFIKLPIGGAYLDSVGGAFINELGIKFYENVILDGID